MKIKNVNIEPGMMKSEVSQRTPSALPPFIIQHSVFDIR
jgi:hypothetical protein